MAKILVIDDDRNTCKVLSDVLKLKGYSCAIAYSAKEAIEEVEKGDIDLAIIDLKLPDKPGIEVLKEIKKLSPRTEAIILTGYASLSTAIEALDYGAFSYIEKPYKTEHLINAIKRTIERKHLIEEKERAYKALDDAHRKLKTLWRLQKEIISKESLRELIEKGYGTIQNLFPDAHIFILLLNAKRDNLFPLERLNLLSKIIEGQRHFHPPNDLIDWLASTEKATIIKKDPSIILNKFLYQYPIWYAIPVVAESGCIGCLIIALDKEKQVPEADMVFVKTLFSQIAGPIAHAISMEEQIEALKERAFARTSFHGLVGVSKVMQDIYNLIKNVAPTNVTVLITGENGTGKELAAMAIHECSTRRDGPFVVANCSAYPVTLLESELFGHERGAFTGAIRTKRGRFELAHNGTIFLDEIGELPSTTQLLLLRVLQSRCFERVGGEKTINVDVRVIAATNKDLKEEKTAGRFREDLYYRLKVVRIHMPPLRERKEDIPLLCDYFLKKFCEEIGREVRGFTAQAMRSLIDYNWPGNVRELENVIQQAIILTKKGVIEEENLPSSIKGFRRIPVSLIEHERQFILRVLKECNLNKHEAARRLKISRATLYSKIKRYGLEKTVTFRFKAPQAKSVYLVGSFNNWNTAAMPMKRDESGIWRTDIKLAPGTYEYRFYVDGQWQNDPEADVVKNPFGTLNNVLVAK